ncbi:MAG: RNA 2',3'-cyclic phosphodiesterase [Altererythrobacter sp.]|nr:RNA 2',3'-cyclic phosphodiesterase [Altererythrobacter sp.]OJU59248.1 MAG: 2'-5' RNA ligase [Altererythrobacter sp. 66-12]
MPHRLFVAIRPPAPVRDALIDAMEGVEGARWQDEAALHLTLRFVGEVETPGANDLAGQLSRIAWPPFELRVAGVGAFERKGSPHAIWARVPGDAALDGLRQKVERACESAALGRETRRFTPHITLARLNRSAGPIGPWLAARGDLAAGPWSVEDFVLYESHLGHEGARYEAVEVYPLRRG